MLLRVNKFLQQVFNKLFNSAKVNFKPSKTILTNTSKEIFDFHLKHVKLGEEKRYYRVLKS